MNADGSAQTRLTSANPAADLGPAWSPDGSKIAFSREDDIYVMNAGGSGQTPLTTGGAADVEPSWSPDGSKIAFTRGQGNNMDIFVINADGSAATAVVNGPVFDRTPSWSSAR
jgi:TolB protein